MTNLRPGLGSYTPNWGTHDDRIFRDIRVGFEPLVSLRHKSDPTHGWIGPRAGDRRIELSNPKESDLDCTNLDWATR